jgi:hypothetical protein
MKRSNYGEYRRTVRSCNPGKIECWDTPLVLFTPPRFHGTSQAMTLPEILADPSISSWLKDAIKMAYEQDPLDALRDAHRLLKMLGERYTQVVNRDLVH